MIAYAELHCVSNFSFLRGASHPAELVTRAHELGYRALALTDECSMAGVVRAHEAAQALPEGPRLQLIVGAEFRCSEGLQLVLLAPDQRAYSELCRLITRARRRAAKGCYALTRSDLESGLDHCLALWLPALDGTLAEGRALVRLGGSAALERGASGVIGCNPGELRAMSLHGQFRCRARFAQDERSHSSYDGSP